MAGLVYLDNNIWRYENAGTADLLSVTGTTLTGLDTTQAKKGIAFYQTNRAKCFDIPATKEIWIKFDVYTTLSTRWRAYNQTSSNGSTGICSQTSGTLDFWVSDSNVREFLSTVKNQLQTILLHMVSNSAGVVEAWIDGTFIYRYTGNVNNGNDFADIYLQSDGAGTFFSNVIISNAQIDINDDVKAHPSQYVIAPEIFTSVKPIRGFIGVTPELYAVIDCQPKFERAIADTNLRLGINEKVTGDTSKKIGRTDNATGDTLKHVKKTEQATADTCKVIKSRETAIADTLRVIFIPPGAYFKPNIFASVKPLHGFIGVTPEVYATLILAPHFEQATADTLKRVGITESARADTLKRIVERTLADTKKIITRHTEISADTLKRVAATEKVHADTLTRQSVLERTSADTRLKIIYPGWTVKETAIADTFIRIIERATADTLITVKNVSRAIADTVVKTPHILRYVIEDNPVALRGTKSLKNTPAYSLVNSFKDAGITGANITLNEKTLSDNFQFETTHPMEINDAVKGQLLDYPFSFLVEETSQRDFVQTVKGMYDVDKLLYTQFFIPPKIITGDSEAIIKLDSAADYIQKAADYLGFTPNILIDDFTPFQNFSSSQTTYRDLLSAVFGWTSRLPQRQINVFIRGNILHCIQRGKELATFDISDLPHSRPVVNKSLIRSLWNKPNPDDDSYNDDDNYAPFNGTIGYVEKDTTVNLSYSNGLLKSEKSTLKNGKTDSTNTARYSYWHDTTNDVYYMDSKESTDSTINVDDDEKTKVEVKSTTTYTYRRDNGEIFLYQEVETVTKSEYDYDTGTSISGWILTESSTSIRQTLHTPIGNGWYSQSVYVDGEPQGSNLSQGKPTNSVSQYTVKSIRRAYRNSQQQEPDTYEDWRRRLSAIADTSFPVRELDLIQKLTDALLWLNRKVQMDVSTDLISPINNGIPTINHIVDFTERIILDGAEYFLVSNQIEFTTRKFIQHLRLIRWY